MDSYTLKNVTKENFGVEFYALVKYESDKFIQKNISKTSLFRYFLNYLILECNGLDVHTIVRENDYTCLNYLDDYANYYARCYTLYEKHCRRIHFFSGTFQKKVFSEMLQDPKHEIWKTYQGCIVIKPLPKGVFGITYLNTYQKQNEAKNRYYTCLSLKKINLFGHELEIETMPFKEQDGIVASCATTALWMAFQKTSELFNTKAPSLSEVTILAGDKTSNSGKIFPSKGLEVYQVCKAINNNGLISELRTDISNERYFKGYIYAYLKGDVPVLLGLRFSTGEEHLVTINGYRFRQLSNEIKYVSDRIERLYVHDDQIGPFSRLIINNNQNITIKENNEEISYNYDLTTSWWKKEKLHEWINKNGFSTKTPTFVKDDFENATTAYVITPLAPVIKITYDDIFEQQEIISFVTNSFMNLDQPIVWDIFMIKSNEYKKWLIEKYERQNNVQLESTITQSLPQYIWVIQAWIGDMLIFDYIYDTIELNKTGQPVAVNVYEEKLLKDLKDPERIDILCSSGFFVNKYESSLLRTINEFPYDLKEVKQWLSAIFKNEDRWDVTKLKLEQLWNLEEELLKSNEGLSFPRILEKQFLRSNASVPK